ncbi:BA75_00620T0 [Komagataella pastoris]|uniref:BA75_00620T0 n=1 Tax=Komagataella pastoris TaxID=4922 RepID=A0A1B2J7H1_PICPA|nr:BA75_00620T0 [Komagataella pastoris]
MSKTFTITALAALGATVGYAIYFDYQRRNNSSFRKTLKKNSKSYQKKLQKDKEQSKKQTLVLLKKRLEQALKEEPVLSDVAEKEQYFYKHITLGEQLSSVPNKEIDAAIEFYKALSTYPNPTSILNIYQKSVREDIYELVVMLIAIQPPQAVVNILGESSLQSSHGDDVE